MSYQGISRRHIHVSLPWWGADGGSPPWLGTDTFVFHSSYEFDAYHAGTYMYHSHDGVLTGDGVFGALIVRAPHGSNPHYSLYDHDCQEHPTGECEHTAAISGWYVHKLIIKAKITRHPLLSYILVSHSQSQMLMFPKLSVHTTHISLKICLVRKTQNLSVF